MDKVQDAWALYDIEEAEAWEEYKADPNFVTGHRYKLVEHLAYKRMVKNVALARRKERERRGSAPTQ